MTNLGTIMCLQSVASISNTFTSKAVWNSSAVASQAIPRVVCPRYVRVKDPPTAPLVDTSCTSQGRPAIIYSRREKETVRKVGVKPKLNPGCQCSKTRVKYTKRSLFDLDLLEYMQSTFILLLASSVYTFPTHEMWIPKWLLSKSCTAHRMH